MEDLEAKVNTVGSQYVSVTPNAEANADALDRLAKFVLALEELQRTLHVTLYPGQPSQVEVDSIAVGSLVNEDGFYRIRLGTECLRASDG
jgi:hypothetical protein